MSVREVKGCKEGGGKLSLDEGRGEGLQRGGEEGAQLQLIKDGKDIGEKY